MDAAEVNETIERLKEDASNSVLYLCDHKACHAPCSFTECKHTTNIDHAANFERMTDGSYWEKERSKSDDIVIRTNVNLKLLDLDNLHKKLVEMKESGVILLPQYWEVVSVPDASDVKIEEETYAHN